MDESTVLTIAPQVLKRMEYGIDRFYLLNLNNDEMWVGNYASYLVISKINGQRSIEAIVKDSKSDFNNYSFEELYNTTITILGELVDKKFLEIIK